MKFRSTDSRNKFLRWCYASGTCKKKEVKYYSSVKEVLINTNQKTFSAQQLKGFLKGKGITDREIAYYGIDKLIETKNKITKEELLELINPPKIKKIVLHNPEIHIETKNLSYPDDEYLEEMIKETDSKEDLIAYIENDVINEVASISSGINAMACDGFGSVWLATGDGLKRYYRATGEIEEYTAFNSSLLEGLTNSFVIDNEKGYIWLATDHGFWRGKLESSLSGDGSEVRIYPNPFIPATGDVLGIAGIADIPTDISIFDLQGSLVHSFSVERRSEIAWNGINSDGKLIASGIYFLQVNQADTEFELLKFTIVR